MSKYETDEEQIAAIKSWWKENSTSILSSVLIVAVSWSGWTYYKNDQLQKSASASAIFEMMQISMEQGNFGDIAREGMKLLSDQPSSPYSTGASLLLAKHHVQNNKMAEAIVNLNWVVDNSTDGSLVLIAKLRLAELFLDKGDALQAENTLKSIDADSLSQAEQASFSYTQAMVALKSDKFEDAKGFLQQVIDNKKSADNLERLAKLQLDDLG